MAPLDLAGQNTGHIARKTGNHPQRPRSGSATVEDSHVSQKSRLLPQQIPTVWLTWEDSNSTLPLQKKPFEMSTEFYRLFFLPKFDLETFAPASCGIATNAASSQISIRLSPFLGGLPQAAHREPAHLAASGYPSRMTARSVVNNATIGRVPGAVASRDCAASPKNVPGRSDAGGREARHEGNPRPIVLHFLTADAISRYHLLAFFPFFGGPFVSRTAAGSVAP